MRWYGTLATPRQDVLAKPPGRFLPASRHLAGGGDRRQRADPAGGVRFRGLAGPPSTLSGYGLAVVFGRAGADDRDNSGGRPGDGRPVRLRSIDWLVHHDRLGTG